MSRGDFELPMQVKAMLYDAVHALAGVFAHDCLVVDEELVGGACGAVGPDVIEHHLS